MCKWIKDILWPLNLLGKKMRSAVWNMPSGGYYLSVTINWSGERLIAAYTQSKTYETPGQDPYTVYIRQKEVYENGNMSSESISIMRGHQGYVFYDTPENKLHFICTNVTYLEVNGTVLING